MIGRIAQKISLYYHTLRYLKWVQIRFRAYYYFRQLFRKIVKYEYSALASYTASNSLVFIKSINTKKQFSSEENCFEFLNLKKCFGATIDWNFALYGKLWTYNLNYFEYLLQSEFSKERGLALINDFINHFGKIQDGLEPYPTSLRIIHWIKFISRYNIQDDQILKSLRAQLSILSDNLEFHLLGNHVLENGFALLFGSYFFEERSLYEKAKFILVPELKEQILPDGAHFELSPMYHQLMLFRVLDCYNIMKHNSQFDDELLPFLELNATRMLGWLRQISFNNGDIPLLNDSAYNINPTTSQLLEYSSRLDIKGQNLPFGACGYRKFKTTHYEMVVDVGPIGPAYITGHGHSDALHFILYLKEHPFIVDTGTSDYNTGKRREAERATKAHNTVELNNKNQSEIWASFRTARRAQVRILEEKKDMILAEHDGYKRLGAIHRRKFEFSEEYIVISDFILSEASNLTPKAYLHFHPDITPVIKDNVISTHLGHLLIDNCDSLSLLDYEYAPEFNKRRIGRKVAISFWSNLLIKIIPAEK